MKSMKSERELDSSKPDFWSGHFNIDSSSSFKMDNGGRNRRISCVSRRSLARNDSSMITIDEDKQQIEATNKYNKIHDHDYDYECTSNSSSSSTKEHILNFDREVVRMEALEVYILVSTLTSIAALTGIESIEMPLLGFLNINTTRELWEARGFYYCTLLVSTVSGLSGLYAAGIFSLCVLYGKTSLGLDRDPMYHLFIARTARFRARGFRAFSISLACFSIQILIITISKIPSDDRIRIPISLLVFSLTWMLFQDWKVIISIATPIFTNVLPEEFQNKEDDIDDVCEEEEAKKQKGDDVEYGTMNRRKYKHEKILNIKDYVDNSENSEIERDPLGVSTNTASSF